MEELEKIRPENEWGNIKYKKHNQDGPGFKGNIDFELEPLSTYMK